MRTKTLLIAAVVGAAGLASAQAQVSSVNAVGYVNKELSAGLNLLSNPLSNGENKIGEVIPVAPFGSTVFVFNGASFDQSTYVGVWDADISLPVGVGFFIEAAEAATITFVGEVLQGVDTNKQVPAGLSIQGSLVPQAGTLTELGFPAAFGDTVFTWNGTGYDFDTYLGVWGAEPSLSVGGAVFVDKAEAGAWDRNFSIQ